MKEQDKSPARARAGLNGECAVKKLRKIGKALLVIVLVAACVHAAGSLIFGRRFASAVQAIKDKGEPVSMNDLAGPPVPDAENAALIYEKIFSRLASPEGEKRMQWLECVPIKDGARKVWTGTDDHDNDFITILHSLTFWSNASKAAAYFNDLTPMVEAAVAMPKCRFKAHGDGYGRMRPLLRLLCATAILQARSGNMDKAYSTIEMAFKASQATLPDNPTLIAVLAKCALITTANDALLDVMKYGAPNARQAQALNSMLDTTDCGPDFTKAVKGERAYGMSAFEWAGEGRLSELWNVTSEDSGAAPPNWLAKPLSIAWHPVLWADGLVYLDYMKRQIEVAALPYRSAKQKLLDQSIGRLPRYVFLTRIIRPIFAEARLRIDATRAETALTQVVLAAQQYKTQTGTYPASLGELSAKTGRKLPQDPFSGKDLIYKRVGKGFHVYSISGNLRDDGGVAPTQQGNWDTGDIVVHWTH
jgi:hypothetical protein